MVLSLLGASIVGTQGKADAAKKNYAVVAVEGKGGKTSACYVTKKKGKTTVFANSQGTTSEVYVKKSNKKKAKVTVKKKNGKEKVYVVVNN